MGSLEDGLARSSNPFRWERLVSQGDVYTPRTGHAVVNEDGVFYLFGGTDGAARQSDVHAYNMETNLWQEIKAGGRAPPARSGAQAVVWDGSVWFFGGYTKKDGDYFNDVYSYNIQTCTWGAVSASGEAPCRRTDHSVVLYNSSMLVFGGFDGQARFNDLRALSLPDRRWTTINCSHSVLPRSRFGHTAVLDGNSMYIFGGWDGHDTLQELWEYTVNASNWILIPHRGSAPRARYRHTAVVCGDAMFTFGGVDKTQYRFPDLHQFCFITRHWSKVSGHARGSTSSEESIPSARTFHKTVVHEGYMYVLGGFDGRRLNDMYRVTLRSTADLARHRAARTNEPGPSSVLTGPEVSGEHLPEELWVWHRCDDYTGKPYTPRTGHAVVVYNNCFYLMGGTDENARQNDIYKYDVRQRHWTCIENVTGTAPSARSGCKAVVCRDSIFFFGGYTKKDGDYFNDLLEFNIPFAHWTCIDADRRPSVRTDHSCVVYEANLYIFGGFDGRSRFSDLHQYSIEDHAWTDVPSSDNGPMGRFGHSAVVYRATMFIFGGWNGHDTLDDLYEFSMTTNQWYSVPGRGEIPQSRYRHSVAVHGCCMFVFGGVDKRQARFSDLYEFGFDTRTWARVQTTGDAPSARTFHRAVMYGGCMYILGGFDGNRRNDMYRITVPERAPAGEEKRKRRQITASMEDCEAAAEPEADEGMESNKERTRFRLQVLELQKRLEAEVDRHLCKICYEREINTVVMDCHHRAVCAKCLGEVDCCPLCRAPISQIIETFNA